jgi:ligand-binding SRPBCC domain-containing protein
VSAFSDGRNAPSPGLETFEVLTMIAAPPGDVWDRVTTPAGINGELRPFVRMTVPRSMRGRTIADVAAGSHVGRSWLLLFGVLPFEYDDIGIAELESGCRFVERSSMLSMRQWEHERTVVGRAGGCEVRDRVAFELRGPLSRIPGLARLLRRVLRRLFQHRHRRLARHFSEALPNRSP